MADSWFVGLELNEKEVRLCVYDTNEKEAVTVMVTAGGSRAECPAHMAYLEETGQWKYGIEADYFADKKESILLDNILEQASGGRDFEVNGRTFACAEVLAEMFRQALLFAGIKKASGQIRVLVVTVPAITKPLTGVVEKAFSIMGLRPEQAYLQCFDESFFVHTYYQKPEVFSRNVGMFYFTDETNVEFRRLHSELSTKPTTVTVTTLGSAQLSLDAQERDEQFSDFIREYAGGNEYSSFFLVGKGFDRQWSKASLGLLCRAQRKVFYGNNLFSKGACFAAREKSPQSQIRSVLFLGNDLVRKNIGIEMLVDGIAMYHPLITAGVNWYEAENSCELLLNEERNLIFRVSRMEDGRRANYSMPLPGLPERPPKASRLRVHLRFESVEKCVVTVEDLGFGEIFPTSGMTWTENL